MNDAPKADEKPNSREAERAEALRANLLRRKAQARGRVAADLTASAKSPSDA